MRKLKNILEVHQLAEQGFNISAIARKCQLSRTTVYDYLAVDFEKAARWVDTLQSRKKKLDPYKEIIVTWLMEHPDLSASQISDWLEEKYSYTGAGDSTVRAYVKELRELHHIPKSMTHRNYEAVPELPKGYQMQVDFGEISVKSVKETSKKLYVIAFVLSHSRHKYAEWQDRPFTTKDVLRCHEHAFQFYGGMTEEIVQILFHIVRK